MQMNLRQIEAFRAVMVTGSGTEAAKQLFITQPAVSRLISDLEYNTGLTLFIRKPNRLEPTPEAQALYKEVDRSFIGLDKIRRAAHAIASKQEGSLGIVAMPICIDTFLPDVVAEFSKLHAGVNIELEAAPRIWALDMVNSQQFELGICFLQRKEDRNLDIQTFCQQRAVCIMAKDHPLASKDEITPHDLKDQPFISLSQGSPFRAMIEKQFAAADIALRYAIETRTQHTIYELVNQGAGISIVDPFIVDPADEQVVAKPFITEMVWNYAIVQSKSRQTSLIAQSFIELLVNKFKETNHLSKLDF
jgi:DNA-binding transcriptional LysR family regulator